MRLFEAILDANQRALAGDGTAALAPADLAGSLPVVALTCVDPRLNPLIPEVLGIREADFIWLRNAGNIITGPLSSTMRSLALACALKGGREIAVIGHTDCQVGRTSVLELTERLKAIGIGRPQLPDNLAEFFGLFGSERQNVLKAVEFIRSSPLIGPHIPVHGLLVDTRSGRLEWLANGYEAPARGTAHPLAPGPAWPALEQALQLAPLELDPARLEAARARLGETASRVEQAAGVMSDVAARLGDVLPGPNPGLERIGQVAGKAGQAAATVEAWTDRPPPQPPPLPSLPIPPRLPSGARRPRTERED
ncbi:MAG: hypothetical protein RJA22_1003 [Verrucomicrobiota bacterium]|jgi:carbonic anhydrase